jgi:hypothetical protein
MAFDFPSSPTVGQTYAPAAGILYTWNGYAWASQVSSIGMTTKIIPFTASGTYTPSAGLVSAIVECVGGGGGGGGVTGISAVLSGGGGGGSGGYSRKALTAAQIGSSLNIVVGAAGVGATSADGTAGGDTYVGASYAASLCGAKGGGGGGRRTSGTAATAGLGGAAGIGDIASAGALGSGFVDGDSATNAFGLNAGGSSVFGGGGPGGLAPSSGSYPGNNASNYGSGGGGATFYNSGLAAGGNGSAGIVVITEFIAVTATAAPGFPVLIQRQDVSSAVATVDFTTGIDSTYDEYEIHFWNVRFVTTGQNLLMQVSQNNGSTWVAAASSYAWQSTYFSGSSQIGTSSAGDTKMILYSQSGFPTTATNNSQMGTIKFTSPSAATLFKQFTIEVSGTTEGGLPMRHVGHSAFLNAGAFNGIRLNAGAGNIGGGTFILYGIKK